MTEILAKKPHWWSRQRRINVDDDTHTYQVLEMPGYKPQVVGRVKVSEDDLFVVVPTPVGMLVAACKVGEYVKDPTDAAIPNGKQTATQDIATEFTPSPLVRRMGLLYAKFGKEESV